MSGFKNITLQEYFIRYGYRYGIKRAVFMMLPLFHISDYENKKILFYQKAYKYLYKKYYGFADVDPENIIYGEINTEEPIWLYWKQGINDAPAIVKKCCDSIEKYAGREVILLSDSNIHNYLILPSWIIEKNKKGNISNAALADIIRLCLLEHYGGTWTDATVYLTDYLPHYITDSDFFAFENSVGLMNNSAAITNWLIHAKPKNEIVRKTRNMLLAYWKNERYVNEYLMMYILLNIAKIDVGEDKYYIPYASEEYSRLLFSMLGDNYNEKDILHCKEMCSVHKLTYKVDDSTIGNKNSIYNAILSGKV